MRANAPRVTTLRRHRGMTQEELALKTGLAMSTVQRSEAGQLAALEALNQIAPCLGMVAADLVVAPPAWADAGPGILLKPERSGIRLVERALAANRFDLQDNIELRRGSPEAALALPRRLEELNLYSRGHARDYDGDLANRAAARVAVDLNEVVDALAAV